MYSNSGNGAGGKKKSASSALADSGSTPPRLNTEGLIKPQSSAMDFNSASETDSPKNYRPRAKEETQVLVRNVLKKNLRVRIRRLCRRILEDRLTPLDEYRFFNMKENNRNSDFQLFFPKFKTMASHCRNLSWFFSMYGKGGWSTENALLFFPF
jgi:hypothetical protein